MTSKKITLMFALSFLIMFIITYSMVYVFDHALFNINKIYMAALMVGAMAIINVLVMGSMYQNKSLKRWLLVTGILVTGLSFYFIRNQTMVGDSQFLKAMIPHHSSAILMCEKAKITDPEIKNLCNNIVQTQKEEIEIMQQKLDNYKAN